MRGRAVWLVPLAALLAGILVVEYQQFRVLREIVHAMAVTQTKTVSAKGRHVESFVSGGDTWYVVTTQGEFDPNETDTHFNRRHLAEIQQAWIDHPRD